MFDGTLDPMSLIATMQEQEPGDEAAMQPYEVFRSRREAHRQSQRQAALEAARGGASGGASAGVFGADVEEMWNDPVAEKIGLTGFGRRRARRRNRGDDFSVTNDMPM